MNSIPSFCSSTPLGALYLLSSGLYFRNGVGYVVYVSARGWDVNIPDTSKAQPWDANFLKDISKH